jgi:hypothetical protein
MSAPQMKERPASMLRAMFAGLGSLLNVMDKVRSKPAAEPPALTEPAAVAAEPVVTEPVVTEAEVPAEPVVAEAPVAEAEVAAEPAVAVVEADVVAVEVTEVEPEVAEVEVVTIEAVVTEPVAPVATGGGLPLANYDALTLASLRARLRNLSVGQLTQLLDYEKAHAARADVISMFERRIVKLQAES